MDRAKRGSCPQYNPPLAVEGDTPQQVVVLQFLNKCRWINCCNCDRKMHVLAKFIIVLEITVQWYAPVCTFLLRLLLLLYRCRCSGTGLGQPPALVLPSSTRVAVVANHRHSGLQSGGGLQSGSSEEEGATSWLQADACIGQIGNHYAMLCSCWHFPPQTAAATPSLPLQQQPMPITATLDEEGATSWLQAAP